jgi:hypothetical protein
MRHEQHGHAAPLDSDRSNSRICAWTVTSRAVVGSSAINNSGSPANAMAIITRWQHAAGKLVGKL